jgi:hypothetical protein
LLSDIFGFYNNYIYGFIRFAESTHLAAGEVKYEICLGGVNDFILGHKTALGEVQIGNTPFVHEQDHYISSLIKRYKLALGEGKCKRCLGREETFHYR